jgi:hypothetical protein
MKKISKRLTSPKDKSDFVLIFALVVWGLSPWTEFFWYFIPAATSIILQAPQRWTRAFLALSVVAAFFIPVSLNLNVTDLDLMAITILLCMGFILYFCKQEKRSFLSLWTLPLILSALAGLVAMGSAALQTPGWNFLSWADLQIESAIFPASLRLSIPLLRPDENSTLGESLSFLNYVIAPLYQAGVIGVFAAMMTIAFPINGMMENMLKSVQASNLRGQSRVFDRFSRWRAPERALIPLTLGLGLLIFYEFYPQGALWAQILGATLLALSLSAIHMNGMALASFMIPRLSFFLAVACLLMVFLRPIEVLVLAGLTDLWFDLRSKWESPSNPA